MNIKEKAIKEYPASFKGYEGFIKGAEYAQAYYLVEIERLKVLIESMYEGSNWSSFKQRNGL